MTIYSDEEARRQLDAVLEQARAEGEVRIRRGNGQEFVLRPAPGTTLPPPGRSALDVGYVHVPVTAEQIVTAVREGRERHSG